MIRLETNITRLAPRLGITDGGKAYTISETQKTMACVAELAKRQAARAV